MSAEVRSEHVAAAIEAARAAGNIIDGYYRRNVEIRLKDDRSPVTIADIEAERCIRARLTGNFPDYGFYGEETGITHSEAEYLWLVDPIDGTKGFVRDYPMFSTQIALMHRGRLVLGVSNASAYGELIWAERGRGAWLGDRRLRVSEVTALDECTLSTGNLRSLAAGPRWPALGRLVQRIERIRGYGDFLHYHLLAGGHIDAVVESDVNILDIAALVVVIEEAGGCCTDLDGEPVDLATTSILATNSRLHGELLAALGRAG